MPITSGFEVHPWVVRIVRIRQRRLIGYGLAMVAVTLAVGIRWLVEDYIGARSPFITFYPAIIVATLFGGLRPGVVATILSGIAAWCLYIAPLHAWQLDTGDALQLLLFFFINFINVAIVALLDALIDNLIVQQRGIRLLFDSAPNGFVLVDSAGRIKLANAGMGKLFGYEPAELIGKPVELLVPGRQVEEHRKQRETYQDRPELRAMGLGRDLRGRRKDGTEFPVEIGLNPVGDGLAPEVLATVVDISARKQVEESQHLLIRELQHRTRNLFAVVQAIVISSLKGAASLDEASRVANGRIIAVAQAYTTLPGSWEGTSLAKMLTQQLAGHADRTTIEGCEIAIAPRLAQDLALVVHELATNALKHGALSAPSGRVAIKGHNMDGTFVFSWSENGGPPVSPPARKGFGSVILQQVAQQFASSVAADYAAEGFSYRLSIPLSAIDAA